MHDLLIDKLGDELGLSGAHRFIVAAESALELQNAAFEHEFANLRELGVDDSDKSSEDIAELRRSHLGFHNRASEQPTPSHEVLGE